MKVATPAEAARVLAAGGVALVPTETVVGIAAGERGLAKLARIKGRDPDKPIALLCRSSEEAFGLAREVPPLARRLAELYWPGALTLVLEARAGGTVGVRVPDHPVVAALLDAYGGPLHVTSANLAGRSAPRSLGDVDPRVARPVDVVVEGEGGGGEASAVVDLSGDGVRVLRASGELTEESVGRLARDV